jgi:hypothetical protein
VESRPAYPKHPGTAEAARSLNNHDLHLPTSPLPGSTPGVPRQPLSVPIGQHSTSQTIDNPQKPQSMPDFLQLLLSSGNGA